MNQPIHILILTYWSFDDALIQTYTLPYLQIIGKYLPQGSKIFLVTLDNKKSVIPLENPGALIQYISLPYVPFGAKASLRWITNIFKLVSVIKRENISTIHAWCTPAGMIAYILSILTGRKLIIDSFEPHAEAMVENGEWKKNSIAFKLLFVFEKRQAKRAEYLIAASEGMRSYSRTKYGHTKDNFFVKPACVDLDLFSQKNIKNKDLLKKMDLENKIVCVYAGKFGGIYLEKEVFDLLKTAEKYWGNTFRAVILSSHESSYIKLMSEKAGLSPVTIIHTFVPHNQIPDYLGLGDFALTPVKPVSTKRFCTPIKDGEYWALGLPIIITDNISDDSGIIENYKIGAVLKAFDPGGYLKAIQQIDNLLKNNTRMQLYNKIRPFAEKYRNFEIAENIYSKIYGNK